MGMSFVAHSLSYIKTKDNNLSYELFIEGKNTRKNSIVNTFLGSLY